MLKTWLLMALVRSDVIINQETSQFKIIPPGLSTQCVKIVCVDCWSHFGDSSTGTEVMNLISSAIILHFILHDHGHARTWSLVTGVTVCAQVSRAVLPGIPGAAEALPPHHHPLHHDAAVWHLRASVPGWHRLHPQDPGRGENGREGTGLFSGTVPQRLWWFLDHKGGLVFPQSVTHRRWPVSQLAAAGAFGPSELVTSVGGRGGGAQSPFRDDIFSPMSVFAPVVRGVSSGALVCSLPLLSKATFTWNSH